MYTNTAIQIIMVNHDHTFTACANISIASTGNETQDKIMEEKFVCEHLYGLVMV